MEDCEESGAGKEKERKLWTGFHLGSAIFITRRPEQGLPCLPGRASQPSSSWECTSPGRLGAPTAEGRPLQGRLLREGQRRLKGKRNKLAHLVLPFSPALTEPLWMGIPMSRQTPGTLGWLLSPLQLQSASPRTPAHPPSPFRNAALGGF